MAFSIPVLLLAFRLPEATKQVLGSIHAVAPVYMFVACDGPRSDCPDEAKCVRQIRALIDREIDWPSEVKYLYRTENLGC